MWQPLGHEWGRAIGITVEVNQDNPRRDVCSLVICANPLTEMSLAVPPIHPMYLSPNVLDQHADNSFVNQALYSGCDEHLIGLAHT